MSHRNGVSRETVRKIALLHTWNEPVIWVETPKWHPRRILFNQNWRRFIPDHTGFSYENEGWWEYTTDIGMALWGLRDQAGLPDETIDNLFME